MSGTTTVIDADALLRAGQVPIGPVLGAAAGLGPDDLLHVLVSFPPTPLIERLENEDCECTLGKDGERFVLVVRRTLGTMTSC